jgi:hypothetical protein
VRFQPAEDDEAEDGVVEFAPAEPPPPQRNQRLLVWFCAVGFVIIAVIAVFSVVLVRDYLHHRNDWQHAIVTKYEKQTRSCVGAGGASGPCSQQAYGDCTDDNGWGNDLSTPAKLCEAVYTQPSS